MSDIDVIERPRQRSFATGGAPAHVVEHRRTLPATRAVAGAFLVVAAVVGLFFTATGAARHGGTTFAVAAHDLAPGQRIAATDIALVSMDLSTATASHAFTDADALVGATAASAFAKGELIQRAGVVPAGKAPGFREVTVAVDPVQARAVVAGDTVDVLVSTGSGEGSRTDVVVSGARVLRSGGGAGALASDAKPAVAFAVADFAAVNRLVQAAHVGSLTLVRANGFASQPTTFTTVPTSGKSTP